MRYLQQLTTHLTQGLTVLSADDRSRHVQFLLSFQNADGGFSGREGASDLYYTGFALRGLAVLDELTPELADRTAPFLRNCLSQSASIVDFYSLLFSCLLVQGSGGPDLLADSPADWPDRVAATLETFRAAEGGYAKSTGAKSGSTYHTFLVGLCYEMLGRGFLREEEILRFVDSRRRDDGGYVELGPMRKSGTNPTAAAVGIVQLIRGEDFDGQTMNHVVDFIAQMASMEGGLCANTRIPVADLLSTFTGAWTLSQLGALDRLDLAEITAYATSLLGDDGGFRGGIWDERSDVEYTFYGLGTVALTT
jgi:geranylgeranyl transferase type-2 subunit beta